MGVNNEKKLAKKIEDLTHRINLYKELPVLRKEKYEIIIERKLAERKDVQAGHLLRLEKETVDSETLFEHKFASKKEKLKKISDLELRAFRQAQYAKENLLDVDYNRIGELSSTGQKAVSAKQKELDFTFQAACKKEFDSFLKGHPKKTDQQLNVAHVAYQQAIKQADLEYNEAKETLNKAYEIKLSDYRKKMEASVKSLEKQLIVYQDHLAQVIKENEALHAYTLPEDVILRLDDLSMHFGGLKAVDHLSFDVKKGEIFGLIGPNGAGKTTVFNCITQFYKPTKGNILYRTVQGRVLNLNNYAVHNIIKLGIVRTFQNVELIPELTVLENLLIAAHTQYKTTYFAHLFNTKAVRREEIIIRKKAMSVLEYLDLVSIKDLPPIGLPYGVMKRIELARTLMANANLIILDEPAAGLNDKESEDLADMIQKIAKEFKATIFLVEHDMGLVMDVCDHICAISFGRKLAYGTPTEIQADKVVQEAYLGSED